MAKKNRKIDPLLKLELSMKDGASESEAVTPQDPNPPATPKAEKKRLKKLRKQEKKEAKRKKKEAKRNRFVLYDPQKMQGFAFSLPIGYFLRFFSIGFSLFGVLWLFCDAFDLTAVSAMPLLFYCVAMVSAFSMIFIGKWFTLAGFGVLAAWVGLFFWQAGNPLTFYVSGIETVFNAMMYRLTEAGFAASASITLPYMGGLSDGFGITQGELLSYGGVFALATVFALIFAAFSAKRTRLLPMIILGGGLCAVCFTYNLCRTNWGIACVLAGLCSAAVLSAYDKTYKAHKHSRKSRAYSGYSSALAGILALAIAAVPASSVKERWGEIDFLADPIKQARLYLTTILTGGNPAYNKMNTPHERFSNKLEDIEFEEVVLFKVTSPTKHPVYLRSWIGGNYDYQTDDWVALSATDYSKMLSTLVSEPGGFLGDYVTFGQYALMAPALSDGTFQERGMESDREFGYSAAFINIEYVNNTGQLFVLPSAYSPQIGMQEHGTLNKPYSEGYTIQADGMLSSGWFNLKKSYTAAAVMPSYYTAEYATQAERAIQYYKLLIKFINEIGQKPSTNTDEVIYQFQMRLKDAGLEDFPTGAVSAYLQLNTDERARWYSRNVRLVSEYGEYVKDFYTQYPTESKAIQDILKDLSPDLEAAATTHDKIMVIIDYLTDNYSYTFTPTKPERETYSALDVFLTETKDGYCVQFASAATLLLRAAGLPARYVQGYVADATTSRVNDDGKLEYYANVKDSDAHAWVEVYIDGLGWRTYEATSVYYEDMYYIPPVETTPPDVTTQVTRPPITTSPDLTTRPDIETAPVTKTPSTEEEEEEIPTVANDIDPEQLARIGVGLLFIALLAALILWQYKRAKKVSDGRAYYIERSVYGSFEEKSDFDKVAGVLCDSILEIHGILGNRPLEGEFPTDFARRVDMLPIAATRRQRLLHARLSMLPYSFKEIILLVEKHEFGRALTRSDLEVLGTYLRSLIDSEYRKLPIYKKIWYRYIRFMI